MYLLSPVITTGRERSSAIFCDKFSLPDPRQQFYTASRGEWSNLSFFLFNFGSYTLFFLVLPRCGSGKLRYVFTALPRTTGLTPSRKKVYHNIKTGTFIILIFFNFEFFEFCPAKNGFLPTVRRAAFNHIRQCPRSRDIFVKYSCLVQNFKSFMSVCYILTKNLKYLVSSWLQHGLSCCST